MRLVKPPEKEPITLEDMKNYLRVDLSDDDKLISTLITAARTQAEQWTRRALITQTWEETYDKWPDIPRIQSVRPILIGLPYYNWETGSKIPLRPWPVQEVESIKYRIASGEIKTWEKGWCFDPDPPRITTTYDGSWPSEALWTEGAIKIMYRCGYGNEPASVPGDLALAVMWLTAHYYEYRTPAVLGLNVNKVPFAIQNVLAGYKVWEAV